jgi:5-methylcytosine-specific restriction endonuclease McrA
MQVDYRKSKIPKALREQVWIQHMGRVFDGHCRVQWCKNTINVFDFQCGHNVPESKGGKTNMDNLIPICARCNNSMGSQFTIDEWNKKFAQTTVPAVESTNCMLRALDRFRYRPS